MKKTLKKLLFMLILTATLLSSSKLLDVSNNCYCEINNEQKEEHNIIPYDSPLIDKEIS